MTQERGWLMRLWRSGELVRLAAKCHTGRELARQLGVSSDALESALKRMRRDDPTVPTIDRLLRAARKSYEIHHIDTSIVVSGNRYSGGDTNGINVSSSNGNVVDDWDEPTHPGYDVTLFGSHETKATLEDCEPTVKDSAATHNAGAANLENLGVDVGNFKVDPVEEHRLKRRVRELEAENERLLGELLNTQDMLGVAREAATHRVAPLEMRERHSGRREACSLIMVSDNHVDEIVALDSVNGLNEHNPDIARARLARTFEGGRWLTQHARQSHLVRDVVLWLGGDHISGTIHEDLRETNAMSLPESIAFAQQLLGDGISHLLEDAETEHLRVVCSTGNHGRLAPGKPRIHTRNETNAETILFLSLARQFAGNERVSFDLPTGVFTYFDVYGRTCRASHGDHLKYGGALGGLTNPINRAVARMNLGRRAVLDIFGHWHTYADNGNWIVNGATVGYGQFSEFIHCPWERPQQAWALLDSKRWRSLSAPVWCDENERQAA